MYQKQVEKLKILKGISNPEQKPSEKDNGYLSIEKKLQQAESEQSLHYIVYRNYVGATLFSGLINKNTARIKEIEDDSGTGEIKAKLAVLCANPITKKYEIEHCEVSFTTDADRKGFIKVFQQACSIENTNSCP